MGSVIGACSLSPAFFWDQKKDLTAATPADSHDHARVIRALVLLSLCVATVRAPSQNDGKCTLFFHSVSVSEPITANTSCVPMLRGSNVDHLSRRHDDSLQASASHTLLKPLNGMAHMRSVTVVRHPTAVCDWRMDALSERNPGSP